MCRLEESNRKQLIHSLTHLCTSVFNSLEQNRISFAELWNCSKYGKQGISPGRSTVVLGDGGSGKTALVIEVVYKLRERFPIQCWLPASSSHLLQLSLKIFLT